MTGQDPMREDLLNAGCGEAVSARIEGLCQAGLLSEALHEMKTVRCGLMEALHRSQQTVDRLDLLIRKTEKELKTTSERRI